MLGQIIFIGKKMIRKISDVSINWWQISGDILLMASENQNH